MKLKVFIVAVTAVAIVSLIEARESAEVVEVYDGDTITVKFEFGNQARVRLIGMDAPEMASNVHGPASKYGPASRDHLAALIAGKTVNLEYDVEKYDKYNRLLAYVFIPGGAMVNGQMLKDGYALLYTIPPNVKYVDDFKAAQKEARTDNKGLWAVGGLAVAPAKKIAPKPKKAVPKPESATVYITRTGSKYHRGGCRYLRKSCIPISLDEARARGYSP